jgi:hypothetical protein
VGTYTNTESQLTVGELGLLEAERHVAEVLGSEQVGLDLPRDRFACFLGSAAEQRPLVGAVEPDAVPEGPEVLVEIIT